MKTIRTIIRSMIIDSNGGLKLSRIGINKQNRVKEFGTNMMPGPSNCRTSFRSFVHRETKSPVSFFWKKAISSDNNLL